MILQQSATFERKSDGAIAIQCSVCFFSGFSTCHCSTNSGILLHTSKIVARNLIFSFSSTSNFKKFQIVILLKGVTMAQWAALEPKLTAKNFDYL